MAASFAERIAALSEEDRAVALEGFDREALLSSWSFWGRPEQFAPPGDWNVWLIVAGRGFGKTRAGAEWVIKMAREYPGCRIALVARTAGDVNSVMISGESGILACCPPDFQAEHIASRRLVKFPNGSIAETYSAEEPDQLRGPQFHFAWADEAAAWKFVKDSSGLNAWDNLRIATRLPAVKNGGSSRSIVPKTIATTTPKRTPFMEELLAETQNGKGEVVITRGTTFDNQSNLSGAYLNVITGVYANTRLAQQELMGVMLDNVEGALFTSEQIQLSRLNVVALPPLRVIAVDPSVAEQPNDECGIVVVGSTRHKRLSDRHAYILEDETVHGSPDVWVNAVVAAARKWNCPVVVEKNQGHALLDRVIHAVDEKIVVLPVSANVGKALRAEPVTLAYDQGRVHHVGYLGELEAQMTGWVPGETRKSPDRLDAMVHGVTALLIDPPRSLKGGGPLRAQSSSAYRLPTGRGAGIGRVAGRRVA